MNRTRVALLSLLLLITANVSWGKTVGLWKDHRSYITDGMLKTLQDEGWKTVILEKYDLADEAKLAELDVVFLPGGWNAYYFANFHARRALVKFVAGGKGVLAAGFRSGYVRTANRPFFPEVGATYNRVNSPLITGTGDSELAKAIDEPFYSGGWDHLVVKVGPKGKVFAVSGGDPVGVYGEVYGGRYVVFGAFIGMDAKTEPMQGVSRKALLTMLDWLADAPEPKDAAKLQAEADLAFLRRERLYDWTIDDRGPDRAPGVLPHERNTRAVPLESRLYTLEYMSEFLTGKEQKTCLSEAKALRKAIKVLNRNYRRQLDSITQGAMNMTAEALTAENPAVHPETVQGLIDAAPGRADEDKAKITAVVKRCAGKRPPVYAAKQVAQYLHGGRLREALMPQAKMDETVSQADRAIDALRPSVHAAKAERAAEEHRQDLATLPALTASCDAEDPVVRRTAVLELGRIGSPGTAGALVKMLKDADEQVRVNAILGLGWMQSKEGVPALIGLLQGRDVNMGRRAAQALGQIGDPRAVKALMANTANPDTYVSENAILALGWLKAKAAVPALLKIVTTHDRTVPEQRGLMLAALRALGHIGDPSAVPALEKLAAEADDFPAQRGRATQRITNIYSTGQTLGLQGHAELALEEIGNGGRREIGIRQRDFLRTKDKFYGLTRRFNAFAGRSPIVRASNFVDEPEAIYSYLWSGGLTGVHQAWGEQRSDPDLYLKLVKAAGEFDLHWIDVMPLHGNPFGGKFPYASARQHGIEKPGAEVVLLKHEDAPAFHGFWSEESYPDVKMTGPEFGTWLAGKYGADFRKTLGVTGDHELTNMVGKSYADYSGPLKAEYLQFCGQKLIAHWRESQEWLHGVRKGCAFTFSVTSILTLKFPGLSGGVGAVIDSNGPENYQSFGRYNAFFMEMHKDGEARPIMSEFYNWYSPSPAHDQRGFALHLMHGECYYNFALNHIFAQSSAYDNWSWEASRWDDAKDVFLKARKIEEYLRVPGSAANVALLGSELSHTLFYEKTLHESRNSLLLRSYQNLAGLWTALNQSQIPSDIIWMESMTARKLSRYRVLVVADARIVTPAQAELLRDWVKAGGVLIAAGSTSLFDPSAQPRKDYALADLFGVNYQGFAGVNDAAQIDTYCWEPGGAPAFKAVSSMDPKHFRTHVHRDVKPVLSLGTYTVADDVASYLPAIGKGAACEYDLPLGYDRVKSGSAQTLAAFGNGDAALTVNRVGEGLCYVWTPIYPGLCYVSSQWEMQPNRLDFWPNVRELLAGMVKGGLAHQNATLPVEVLDVPEEVEVTLRQQPEHNRLMVHLLNYDAALERVKQPHIIVHPPAGRTVKRVFYPDTDTNLKFRAADLGITAKLRDFGVHDMLVIEWQTTE